MNAGDRLYLQFEGAINGPYTSAQMRELAEGSLITPRTPAARAPAGPWQPLETTPHHAEVFPAKAAIGFKPPAFEQLNQTGAPPSPPPMPIPGSSAAASVHALKNEPASAAVETAEAAGNARADAPPNDVRQMVNEVAALEARFAPPPPPRRPWRPSGRLQFVAVLALFGNGVLLAVPLFYDASDFLSETFLRGWLVIYNGALLSIYLRLPKDGA